MTALSSVGDGIATGDGSGVGFVGHTGPSKVDALLEESPAHRGER